MERPRPSPRHAGWRHPPRNCSSRMKITCRVLFGLSTTVAALFLIGGTSALNARPLLDHALPEAGSIVRNAPPEIELAFTEALLPSGSDAVVRKASGGVVSSGKARVIGNKSKMQIPVNLLAPGKYRVEWYATSTDRHQNQGSFSFIVGGIESTARADAPRHRTYARKHRTYAR